MDSEIRLYETNSEILIVSDGETHYSFTVVAGQRFTDEMDFIKKEYKDLADYYCYNDELWNKEDDIDSYEWSWSNPDGYRLIAIYDNGKVTIVEDDLGCAAQEYLT